MTLGESKFRAMKELGTWGKKTPAEEQLLALQARCDTLEANISSTKNKNSNSGGGGGSGSGRGGSGGGGNRRGGKNKSKYKDWQFKKPEGNDFREKKVKQKIGGEEKEVLYYWCPNHGKEGMWVRHKPAKCNNKPNADGSGGPSLDANQVILDGEHSD